MPPSSHVSRPVLLVLFTAIGVAMTLWEPTREILIGPIWLGFTLLLAAIGLVLRVRSWRLDRLRRRGTAATARAITIEETKLWVKEMPRLNLELEVQAPDGAYRLHKRVVVPVGALEALKGGEPLPVRIDPGDRDRIAFDWGALDWGQVEGPPTDIIARGLGAPAGGRPRHPPRPARVAQGPQRHAA